MKQLGDTLREFGFLEDEPLRLLEEKMKQESFKKGSRILKAGLVNHRVYFIVSGLIKVSKKVNGKEVIPYLLKINNLVIATDSFFCGEPTEYEIVALEKTEVVSVLRQELDEICQQYPTLERVVKLIEAAYRKEKDTREDNFKYWTPQEKYDWFEKTHPELLTRNVNKAIYTFLLMSRNTFQNCKNTKYKEKKRKK